MTSFFASGRWGRARYAGPVPWITLVWVAVLLLVHTLVLISGDPDTAFLRFGLWREGGWASRPWKWVSYGLLHGSLWHLAFNGITFCLTGSRVERIAGGSEVSKVFACGVVAGGVFQQLLAPPSQQSLPLVGASGGVLALFLWLAAVEPEARTRPLRLSMGNLGLGVFLAEACLLGAAWRWPDLGAHSLAHACHIGGAAIGWCLGRRQLRLPPGLEELRRARARRESVGRLPKSSL
jgi:membrane associated rhomboid family serine protease